ncbi:MAG: hypothetical protein RBU37_19835 [Myxococcota bacterium]|jgi:hypothetical protein|nr:hypothetical protein [Myxococcota bacterium]
MSMQVKKDGDALLVPARVLVDGALFEGMRRVLPGDEDYQKYLAEYEAGGWQMTDEGNAAAAQVIAKHRRGEL